MTIIFIPPANQIVSEGGAQINQWLHGLIEIAKTCVIFAGGYYAHWLLLRRDCKDRRQDFAAFLDQWRSEVFLFKQTENGVRADKGVYLPKLPQFYAEVARARDAFKHRKKFARLTKRLGRLGAADWKDTTKTEQDIILQAMDELIEFLAY